MPISAFVPPVLPGTTVKRTSTIAPLIRAKTVELASILSTITSAIAYPDSTELTAKST